MPRWEHRRLPLKENHGWTAEPGCKVFVADRGAVRFDVPDAWVITPGPKGSIKFTDREPPDDDGTLEMSIFYLNDQIDWTGLPLSDIVRDLSTRDAPGETIDVVAWLGIEEFERDEMSVAWTGRVYIDPTEKRPACSRLLVARKWNIQPLFTFAYWQDDPRGSQAWDILLKTLILGDYIEDPTQRV